MHKSNTGFEFWDKEKEYIVNEYLVNMMSPRAISEKYKCDPSTIKRHLVRWDIPIRGKGGRVNALYKLNEKYFSDINTSEKSYWIGLLLADGHISKSGQLMLCMKDIDIIEKFKKSLECEHPIKRDNYNNPMINIKCKQYSDDLRKIGFTNRKSYEVDFKQVLNNIPSEYTRDFVRGLIDGDGSVRVYRYDYLNKPQYHFGFTGLKEICEFVSNYLGLDRKLVKESDITYTCVTRNLDLIRSIYRKIYEGSELYLDRKYNTFIKEII